MRKVARGLVIYFGVGLYTGSLLACHQTSLSSTADIPAPVVAYAPTFDALPSNDLPIAFGMMFGGGVDDQARSVAITSDNRVVVGVNTSDSLSFLGVAPSEETSAEGKLIQFNPEGTAVLRMVDLGERIDDIQVSPRTQEIVVGGDMGVVALTNDLAVKWKQPLAEFSNGNGRSDGGKTKVSVAEDGSSVVIRSKNVIFLNSEGEIIRSVKVERSFVNDVAVTPDGKTAYVVGYRNATRERVPVQIAFFYAFEVSTGKRLWRLWDFEGNLVGNDMADSRLYHVKVGANGVVHVAGESAGGNTIYRWDGQDLSTPTLINTDKYHHAYQTKANHITYYGQISPTEQKVIRGQLAIPRRSNNDGNTARVRDGALEIDEAGTVFISGRATASLPNRDQQQVNGENAGSYGGGGEPYLLMVSADLSTRYRWAPLAESDGFASGSVSGLVVQNGVGYLLATIDKGAGFTTPGALANRSPNQSDKERSDVYLAKFRPYE